MKITDLENYLTGFFLNSENQCDFQNLFQKPELMVLTKKTAQHQYIPNPENGMKIIEC